MITRRIGKREKSMNFVDSESDVEQKPVDCQLNLGPEPGTEVYQDHEYEYDYMNDEIYENQSPAPRASENRQKTSQKQRDSFTHTETLHIFKFLLSEITSRSGERQGRVAKRRVEVSSLHLWEKYKQLHDLRREATAYRANYRLVSPRLYAMRGLTLSEKVDLYYGLDIKVNQAIWTTFVETFGAEINEDGVITGSTALTHWDIVHPDTDREEDAQFTKRHRKNWNRFTEFDDGIMWQFVLDYIQKTENIQINGTTTWNKFKKQYKSYGINTNRTPETYRGRYNRMLVPNLHKMPFDIEAKAAIYQSLNYVVPVEFRQQLIDETGVELDVEGRVVDYPNRPKHLVLQSRPYEDTTIGISSTQKTSSLLHPNISGDTVPYTREEDEQIWQHVVRHARDRPSGDSRKLTGWLFWKKFAEEHETTRTWQSLCHHFTNELLDDLSLMDFHVSTKIALYFCLKRPVEDSLIPLFKDATDHLVLLSDGRIRYACGQDETGKRFDFGRKVTPNRSTPPPQPPVKSRPADTWRISDCDESGTDEEVDVYEQAGFKEAESSPVAKRVLPKRARKPKVFFDEMPGPSRSRVTLPKKERNTLEARNTEEKPIVNESVPLDEFVVKEEPLDDYEYEMENSESAMEEKPSAFLHNCSSSSSNDLTSVRNELEERNDYLESLLEAKRLWRERPFDPEEDHDYLYCKRARYDFEPVAPFYEQPPRPSYFNDPKAPIEAAFEDMEKHLRNFCKRLRRERPNLNFGQCCVYMDRVNYLIKMFVSNAKDAIKKKQPARN